jgi:hypothetical protein
MAAQAGSYLKTDSQSWESYEALHKFARSIRKDEYMCNEYLMDLANDDLEEITEEVFEVYVAETYPQRTITIEGEEETIPTPSLEQVHKMWFGYAQNHTGTISSNETWTLANSPHHITGNITIAADVVVTIEAGCDVQFDGNYRFDFKCSCQFCV